MSDELKKDIGNFLYALMAYIIIKDILPKIEKKDDNKTELKDENEE